MGIFDIFTGGAGKDAALKKANYINYSTGLQQDILKEVEPRALNMLSSGYGNAAGMIGPAFDQARADVTGSLDPALADLRTGMTSGADALTSGRDAAIGNINTGVAGAIGAYDPLMNLGQTFAGRGTTAADMAAGALGLGGPVSGAQALEAFRQANPGYDFQVQQATEQAARGANMGGMGASGNALAAIADRTRSMADATYGNWYDRLFGREQLYNPLAANAFATGGQGIANANLTGATSLANINTGTAGRLADLYNTGYGNMAEARLGTGRSLADLAARGGLASADIATRGGTAGADLATRLALARSGVYGNAMNPMLGTYDDAANAAMWGSKNLWDFGGNLAKTAASMYNPAPKSV